MSKLNDGIPRSTIHMGAGSFTLTSSLNGQVSRVDLNDKKVALRSIGGFLCDLHNITYKDAPIQRRRPAGAKRAPKSKPPIGNLPVIDLQAAM